MLNRRTHIFLALLYSRLVLEDRPMRLQEEPIVGVTFGRKVFVKLDIVANNRGGVEAGTLFDLNQNHISLKVRIFGCILTRLRV